MLHRRPSGARRIGVSSADPKDDRNRPFGTETQKKEAIAHLDSVFQGASMALWICRLPKESNTSVIQRQSPKMS